MSNLFSFKTIDETKLVNKPWGQEKWLQAGDDIHKYAFKEIILFPGQKTSLQVHKFKAETNYILEGSGYILRSEIPLDCDKYVNNGYTAQEIGEILNSLQTIRYDLGSVISIGPGIIHRMISLTHSKFIEASTTELDDVLRLHDDTGRGHGRVEHEHRI